MIAVPDGELIDALVVRADIEAHHLHVRQREGEAAKAAIAPGRRPSEP